MLGFEAKKNGERDFFRGRVAQLLFAKKRNRGSLNLRGVDDRRLNASLPRRIGGGSNGFIEYFYVNCFIGMEKGKWNIVCNSLHGSLLLSERKINIFCRK